MRYDSEFDNKIIHETTQLYGHALNICFIIAVWHGCSIVMICKILFMENRWCMLTYWCEGD